MWVDVTQPQVQPQTEATGRTAPASVARRAAEAGPRPYDFRRPNALSRDDVRTLQRGFETFARQVATVLTSSLRVVAQVGLVSIEQLTYQEYVAALPDETMLCKFTVEPLPGTALLEFPLPLAMAFIDHMLGGPGGTQPERQPTDVELPLLRRLTERVLAELRYALEPIELVNPRLHGVEYSPQFAQVCKASEAVLVASFEMTLNADERMVTICLPVSAVVPKLRENSAEPGLTAVERISREATHRDLVTGLANAPIDVSVQFRSTKIRSGQIIDLRPGDVVSLGHPISAPLTLTAAGTTFAYAVPAQQGSKLACLVVATPDEDTNR